MAPTALPENFVRAYLEIEGGAKLDCYFNPTEYSIAKTNTWEAEKVNGKSSPNQKFTSGNPRKMELSLLFDQTMPPFTMSVGEATALLLDAMEVPGGTERRHADRGAAVHHVRLGQAEVQGRVHEPHLHVQAVHARGPGAARRRQAQPDADRRAAQGPEPDHARAGRLRRASRQGRRHAALDLVLLLRRRDGLAPDRGGERDRQPVAPAPRFLAVAPEHRELDAGDERDPIQGTRRLDVRRRRRTARSIPSTRELLSEVKVIDSLTLPDMALVRITDLKGENIDANPLKLGAKIEIKAGDKGANTTESIFKGQIAAVEPEFTPQGVVISARAYDEAHKLNRQKKSRTFQQMSASDMARKVVGEAGLAAGEIKSTSVVHEFFQQSNETDWDFLWRLALMHDYEVVVTDGKLNFRPANVSAGSAVGPALGREPADVPPAHERHPAGRQGRGPRLGPEGQEGRQRQREQPADDVEAGRPAQRRGQGPGRRHDRRHRPRRDHHRRGQRDRQVDAAADGRRLLRGRRRRHRQPEDQGGLQGQGRGRRDQVRRRVHDLLEHALLPRPPRLPDAVPDLRPQRAHAHRARPPARQPRLDRLDRGRRGDQQQRPRTTWSGAREVPEPVRQGRVGVGARRHARAPATRAAC